MLLIWNVKTTPKCKHLIWQAYKGIMPVCTNLKKHGIDVDLICPMCGLTEETIEHALLQCQ